MVSRQGALMRLNSVRCYKQGKGIDKEGNFWQHGDIGVLLESCPSRARQRQDHCPQGEVAGATKGSRTG